MEIITKVLYWISTGLMIPVVVLLLLFFVRALVAVGSFYGMYVQKVKFNKQFQVLLSDIDHENVQEKFEGNKMVGGKALINRFLSGLMQGRQTATHYEKLLNDFEIAAQKDLSSSQTLAKLGPILGLMGTLIPMGPALVGLASGDIASMASNMQVAFSTTVIGLLIGAIGFIIMQVKKRWLAADINNLEFIVELLKNNTKNETI